VKPGGAGVPAGLGAPTDSERRSPGCLCEDETEGEERDGFNCLALLEYPIGFWVVSSTAGAEDAAGGASPLPSMTFSHGVSLFLVNDSWKCLS